tara:strand:- start:234 stop:398 length:165 start_codon:yes stop_codon:yes gene_type:complete
MHARLGRLATSFGGFGLASGKPTRSNAAIIGDELVTTTPLQCLVFVLAAVALVI